MKHFSSALPKLLGAIYILLMTCLPAQAQTPDPGVTGTYAVTKATYDLGDLAWRPPSFPSNVEVRGSVHYPTGLSGGPFPVIVFLHGRHETCYETADPTNTDLTWPCPTGWQSIVSFEGYDYAARQMASHGYIVISVSCNAINAIDNSLPDAGMQARGELVQHHLDLWNTFNTTGGAPFGTTFVGKLDLQRVATMGHSRGGEGVIYHALYNKSLGSPYGLKGVITLAPVDFFRKIMNGIPLMNIAPYCDGDVSDLQGVHFYDDARYNDSADESPKHNVLMLGANHNFFNTVWTPGSYIAGGADDWDDYVTPTDAHCGTAALSNKRFDTTKQKAAFLAYASAFYRMYVGNEKQFAPILNVNDLIPPATSLLDTSNVYVSWHPGRTDRKDINRLDTSTTVTTNTMGGAVTVSGLVSSGLCGGGFTIPDCGISGMFSSNEPHKGSTSEKGLDQMRLRWNDSVDYFQNDIPVANQDLTYIDRLQFRAAENYRQTTTGTKLNFTVQLIDSAGNVSSQDVSSASHALFFPPGSTPSTLPKIVFNTIQMQVSDFTGIDLTKVRSVKFKFNKSALGSILVSDISFVNQTCGKMNAAFTDTFNTIYKVQFNNQSATNAFDTVSWFWKFGDPISGVNDTSTQQNPFHIYSGYGTYTPCLYLKIKRRNGTICMDTICKSVVVKNHAGVNQVIEPEITIIPNPAKDYLYISGAESTDVIKLIDLYGRTVFTATIATPMVQLPQNIAAGIYTAVIVTPRGNVYKKMAIQQ